MLGILARQRKRPRWGARKRFEPSVPSAPPPDPGRFEEAIDFFRARVPMRKGGWLKLGTAARQRGFTIADVAHLDVIHQVWLALDDAIARGATFDEFKEAVTPALVEAWEGTVKNPPARIECLPGDTLVDSAMVRAVHRRAYQGTMIQVVTRDGREFSATPNHPMLTRRGWVGAGALHEGDDLIGYDGKQDARARGDEHVAAPPTTIDQLFRACAEVGTVERALSSDDDFHGDGRNGKVDIARPTRTLRIGNFATLTKPIGHDVFAESDLASPRFCRACEHLIVWSERCGFCDAPVVRSGLLQVLTDGAMRSAESLRQLVCAFASSVAAQEFIGGYVLAHNGGFTPAFEIESPRFTGRSRGTSGLDDSSHAPKGYGHQDGQLRRAHATSIEFDRVLTVRRREFRGHVFNLSTVCGYFTIDGLYTGNTIFRTNVMQANNAGRHAQMTDPAVLERRPFWQYVDIDDNRECPICTACHGTILRYDDPWWDAHSPPNHFACRCRKRPLTEKQAAAMGITIVPTSTQAGDGFGAPPQETAPAFDLSRYPSQLQIIAREKMEIR